MKTCFIAAGSIEWGSSRMRAYWVADALKERGHETYTIDHSKIKPGHGLPNADAYIWQKVADIFWLDSLDGRHYWDVCDPSWWWQPEHCREITKYMTAVIASSQPLADDFNQWYGEDKAVFIPDRLDLTHFTKQRQHTDVSPVRFIWFGVSVNRVALFGAVVNLDRLVANGHNISLTIFDDRPDMQFVPLSYPVYYSKWSLADEVSVLSQHDIALLPLYPGAWGKVKSNNKKLTAWACGLPVLFSDDYGDFEHMMDATNRENYAIAGRKYVESEYTIDKSAAEWEAILCAS